MNSSIDFWLSNIVFNKQLSLNPNIQNKSAEFILIEEEAGYLPDLPSSFLPYSYHHPTTILPWQELSGALSLYKLKFKNNNSSSLPHSFVEGFILLFYFWYFSLCSQNIY